MHFSVIVVIPPGYTGEIGDFVDKAMEPYNENAYETTWVPDDDMDEGGYWTNDRSFWDWYQIGGRWAGHFARDSYDPHKDPRNWERCDICEGSGQRGLPGSRFEHEGPSVLDGEPFCNSCTPSFKDTQRTGWRVKWPTEWVSDTGNVARLGDVREYVEGEGRPYYLVHEGVSKAERVNPDWNGKWGEEGNDYFIPTGEVEEALKKLSDDCTLVIVDCHS